MSHTFDRRLMKKLPIGHAKPNVGNMTGLKLGTFDRRLMQKPLI